MTTGVRVASCGTTFCAGNTLAWKFTPTASVTDTYIAIVGSNSSTYPPTIIAARSNKLALSPPSGPTLPGEGGVCNTAEVCALTPTSGEPVDLSTGAFWSAETDISISGRGPSLQLARTYNSLRASVAGRLGYGWNDSYDWALNVDSGTGQVAIRQDNGSQTVFTPDGSGGYAAPARVLASLTKNSDGTYRYSIRRTRYYVFGANGHLLSISDPNGYTATLAYDSSGLLTTVTDASSRSLAISYDSSNRIHTVTDPLSRSVVYGYDSNGNLSSVTDVNNGTRIFGYDTSHRLTTDLDPRLNTLTNTYDATSGKVSQQKDRRGNLTQYAYTSAASDGSYTTTVTHPLGNKDVYTFVSGLETQVIHGFGAPEATTIKYTSDPSTNQISTMQDGRGNLWQYTYDSYGNKLTATDPLGRTRAWTYNAFNEALTENGPLGVTTTWTYDAAGNLATLSRPLTGSSPLRTATVTNTYGDSAHPGDVTKTTDARSKVTAFGYDTYGDLTSVTDPTGRKTTSTYNVIGWLTSSVSAAGNATDGTPSQHTTTYSNFTAFGKPKTVTDPLGHATTYGYDADQNVSDVTDADGRHTHTDYDENNQSTTVTRPGGTTTITSHDSNGNVSSQKDGLSHTTSYAYDHLDRLITSTDALSRVTRYTYDGNDNQVTVETPGLGTSTLTTTNTYDNGNELTHIAYSDGTTHAVDYTYDASGQRTTMVDGTGTTTYTIDSLNRITQVTNGAGKTVKYTYDLVGNATQITYPNNNSVTRTFDDADRLASVKDWLTGSAPTTFDYDADGNLQTTTSPNTVTGTRVFDNADQLSSIAYAKGTTGLGTYTYTHTSADLLNTAVPSAGAPGTNSTYAYTSNAQLKSTSGASSTNLWTYDAADRVTKNPAGVTFAYDNADQLSTGTPTSGSATAYTYDNRGNRISAQVGTAPTTTYAYNQANELTTATSNTSVVSTYTYDGDGLRASKTPSAGASVSTMTWDTTTGSVPLLLSNTSSYYIYGPDDRPIEQIDGTNAIYLHQDQLGSTVLITDSTGTVTGTYSYDPYGQATHGLTATTDLEFNGQYFDSEVSMIYLRARYYDPATGQFLSADPARAVTRSQYGYAGNDPLNYVDPLGLWWTPGKAVGIVSTLAGASALVLAATGVGAPVALGLEALSVATGAAAAYIDCRENVNVQCGIDILAAAGGGVGLSMRGAASAGMMTARLGEKWDFLMGVYGVGVGGASWISDEMGEPCPDSIGASL